jgi:hypothetical protein
MSERSTEQIRELLDSLYRVDSGRILATLIRLPGDFDLAEEAMHDQHVGKSRNRAHARMGHQSQRVGAFLDFLFDRRGQFLDGWVGRQAGSGMTQSKRSF